MRTARALILIPLVLAFEVVAWNLWPMTWMRWEYSTPDTCCLTPSQILFEWLVVPGLFVLLTHGAVLVLLNEIVRFVVLIGATLVGSPRALVDYYLRSDY